MSLTRLIPAFIFQISISALALALIAQYVYHLEPCILCLYQRIPFIITGFLAVLALRLKDTSMLIPLIIVICGLVFVVGAGIAGYHLGVEQKWWLSECSGTISEIINLQDLRASLMQKAEKSCNDVDWALFGISIATYNVIGSSVLGLASITAGIQLSRAKNK
jgi:disulfide bond formation protein DsbB